MDDSKKVGNNKILFLILGAATVLVALIGATFAFFTAIVNNVNGNQSVMITTQTIKGITYEATEPLALLNAYPGSSAETTFTIHNPNASADAIYMMELITDLNEFVNTDGDGQLILTISGGQLKSPVVFDLTDGSKTEKLEIATELVAKAGKTDTYTVKIELVELNKLQDTNRAKSFVGHIEVTQSIVTLTAE